MIGIFDSGIGGLTSVKAIHDILPDYDITYFGDTARTPYGTKSRETVVDYSIENTRFLIDKGAQVIVMACNTASSVATDKIREMFDIPVFEVITPAVKEAVTTSRYSRIGIIGTQATIRSNVYKDKIIELGEDTQVFSQPCPLLVPLVEEGWLQSRETSMIVKKYLSPLKQRQVDTLILGCTHYPLLKPVIEKKMGKNVRIIDSAAEVSKSLGTFLTENPDIDSKLEKSGNMEFFVSDLTDQFKITAQKIMKREIPLKHIKI